MCGAVGGSRVILSGDSSWFWRGWGCFGGFSFVGGD
jgi:hypothetical protein